MEISRRDWLAYANRLSKLNTKAAEEMTKFIDQHGVEDVRGMIDFAYALVTKYGEASAALSAEMYDLIAVLEKGTFPAAEMAPTASYGEVAKTIRGILKTSVNVALLSSAVGRLVKQAGADTTLRNAIRDRAEFAWIPIGDTCAFCLSLAAEGWQPATNRAVKGDHAEHIHTGCNCTYGIRFNRESGVRGYDPAEYREAFMDAPLDGEAPTPHNRLNALRREEYARNKTKINAQHREAYALRKAAIEAGEIEE